MTMIGVEGRVSIDGGRLVTVFYAAGQKGQAYEGRTQVDVCCTALCYQEEELRRAVREG